MNRTLLFRMRWCMVQIMSLATEETIVPTLEKTVFTWLRPHTCRVRVVKVTGLIFFPSIYFIYIQQCCCCIHRRFSNTRSGVGFSTLTTPIPSLSILCFDRIVAQTFLFNPLVPFFLLGVCVMSIACYCLELQEADRHDIMVMSLYGSVQRDASRKFYVKYQETKCYLVPSIELVFCSCYDIANLKSGGYRLRHAQDITRGVVQ